MKANVDLTEGRDFRKQKELPFFELPDTSEQKDEQMVQSVILCGNAEERKSQRLMYSSLAQASCDRCGAPLDIPWRCGASGTLCRRCEEDLRLEFDPPYPWLNEMDHLRRVVDEHNRSAPEILLEIKDEEENSVVYRPHLLRILRSRIAAHLLHRA